MVKKSYSEYINKRLNSKEANKSNKEGVFSEFVADLKYETSEKFNISESQANVYVEKELKKRVNVYNAK